MVDGIRGRGGSLEREAILAAMRNQAEATARVRAQAGAASGAVTGPEGAGASEAAGPDFATRLEDGLRAVDAEIRGAEALPEELVTGDVADLSEITARMKSAELTFRFSMEIRNKLIEAYREVMRMQV